MKRLAINLAVLSTLGLASQAMATGFVSLPVGGAAVAANANYSGSPAGTTQYVRCNTTGNYGSSTTTVPTVGANNTCAVFPASRNDSPDPAFSTVVATRLGRNITYNGVVVATADERVWSNGGSGSNLACIYGIRYTMTGNPYDEEDGEDLYMEINGFARSGLSSFTAANSVQAAYFYSSVTDEAVFRMGRTYTSVQHRASLSNPANPAASYVHLPLTASSTPSNSITGVATYTSPLAVPTAAQQSASVGSSSGTGRANWVEFTSDNNFLDDDGTTLPDSSQLYVKVTGTGACPAMSNGEAVITANAYSFRQTGQEEAPLIEFKTSGYIPSAGSTTVPSP